MGAKKCGVCGKAMCKQCTKYVTTDKGKGPLAAKMPQGPAKGVLCSDDCAKRSYETFENDIGESGVIVDLTNENNDRFYLRERAGEKDYRTRYFTIPNAPDGRKRPAGDLLPELVDIHDMMKEDLETKDHSLHTSYIKISRG
jgi:hypothetical protein